MSEESELTIEETVALLRQHAFTVPEDSETSDAGRTLIHSRLGGIGADWDLDDAIALAERSTWRGWIDSMLGHNLGIEENGEYDRRRCYAFDVTRPKPAEPKHSNPQDVISLAIQRSRGEDASLQALKDARFIREGLASAGWKVVRWDTGEEAPPVGPPHDEWSATPGAELAR